MVSFIVKNEKAREMLIGILRKRRLPYTANILVGLHRTSEQNRLQRLWLKEAAEQLGENAEELRGYCKLTLGVPILRSEDEEFAKRYDAVVRPLPYETKLALMMEPFDFPVTRLMSTDQKTRYLDLMAKHLLERGAALTEPQSKTKRIAA